ncbi:MAG: glycosyltransferase family 39 protein [Lentisphaeria bacterium]|nr:glycosyltransferase family 39 protein [Lentisphaeria bacterium]
MPGILPCLVLTALLLFSVRPYLAREFWFDEALTLMNFAWLPDPLAVYRSYVIPNNHILYTIFLHLWTRLPDPGLRQDFFMRLPSLLFAVALLWLLYARFRRISGRLPLFLALAALAVSPPFLIYASAVRGYMAGCFFVSLAVCCACSFAGSGCWKNFWGYFAACICAVGTVPSNLLALCGCVLFALPFAGRGFPPWKRLLPLAAAPFAGLVLFYLPILHSFMAVCRIGEGWSDGTGALKAYAAAAAVSVGIPGVLFIFSCFLRGAKYPWRTIMYAAIFLLPLPAVFILAPAPFPRVFVPLFPLLALAAARGVRDCAAFCRLKRGGRRRIFYAFLFFCVIAGGILPREKSCRDFLSNVCGNASGDDFFYGYYMRGEHRPSLTAAHLKTMYAQGTLPPVYLSFASDPWPTMYYLLERGLQTRFLFDGPRGRIKELASGMLVVIGSGEDPAAVEKRFSVRLVPLFANVRHRVYAVE